MIFEDQTDDLDLKLDVGGDVLPIVAVSAVERDDEVEPAEEFGESGSSPVWIL